MRTLHVVGLAGLVCLAACSPEAAPPATSPTSSTPTATAPSTNANAKEAPAAAFEGMDPKTAPGDDFFGYANGGWYKSTEIPKDRNAWGAGQEVDERTNKRIADLIKDASKGSSPEAQKVATAYAAYLDEAAIEQKGLAPITPAIAAVDGIKDKAQLAKALGATVRADVDILNNTSMHTANVLGLWVAEDLDQPTKYAAFLIQGGLGMPDRDFYVDNSAHNVELRTKYEAHVAAILDLAKVKDAKAKAKRIVALETKIAQTHATREEASDVEKGNNHWSRKDLDTKAPGMDWNAFLAAAKLDKQAGFVAWSPKAITGLAALVKSEPLDTWKEYLTFHTIEHAGAYLPKAFVDEDFAFYGKTMNGTEQLRDRWKRAIDVTSEELGEAVGKLYVEKYFPASEKARAQEMVKNIVAAFGRRIDSLTWMSPQTKAKAKAKLATLQVSVGYPDRWRDYSTLDIKAGDALGNAQRAEMFEYERNLKKLGGPVDRGEWVMNPQLVNAVNLPVRNALQFPAAILQPPFFDPNRPIAMDYGSTGSVIGHEISHSFDDTGAMFDSTGKLQNWWTPEDLAHFKASSEALVKQYDAYKPFPDASVKGKQTLGENIADVAGLSAAFDAFELSLGGKPAPKVGGFTGEQQFFIAFAQGWREKIRPETLRKVLVVDGHAPPEYRADTVRNLDPWYAAFDPKPGQKLFLAPNERVRVW